MVSGIEHPIEKWKNTLICCLEQFLIEDYRTQHTSAGGYMRKSRDHHIEKVRGYNENDKIDS